MEKTKKNLKKTSNVVCTCFLIGNRQWLTEKKLTNHNVLCIQDFIQLNKASQSNFYDNQIFLLVVMFNSKVVHHQRAFCLEPHNLLQVLHSQDSKILV